MAIRDEWEQRENGWNPGMAGLGIFRMALLFGSAAVALALILTPIAESQVDRVLYASNPAGVDMMPTGTVGARSSGSYVVRRSVLQPSPTSVCIIRENRMRTGDC